MAGFDPQLLVGGGQQTQTQAPRVGSGVGGALGGLNLGSPQPHHSLIGIVLLAALILFLLDKAGFRFAVTVGRR